MALRRLSRRACSTRRIRSPTIEMAVGSTLGGAEDLSSRSKATGAIEKVYSIDAGEVLLGTLVLHHWDERSGIQLAPLPGTFVIHPEHQEHVFTLANGVEVHEDIFVLSGEAGRRSRRSAGGVLHRRAAQRAEVKRCRSAPMRSASCAGTSLTTCWRRTTQSTPALLSLERAQEPGPRAHLRAAREPRPASRRRSTRARRVAQRWPGRSSRKDRHAAERPARHASICSTRPRAGRSARFSFT